MASTRIIFCFGRMFTIVSVSAACCYAWVLHAIREMERTSDPTVQDEMHIAARLVPYMILFAVEKYDVKLRGIEDLYLFVLGAASFEAKSDWRWLRQALLEFGFAPELKRLHALLANSGKAWDESADGDTCGVADECHAADYLGCISYPEDGVHVTCSRAHFDGQSKHGRPHIVFIKDPGFGQIVRRSWDPAIRYFLSNNITTIVAAVSSSALPETDDALDVSKEDGSELWECVVTMREYKAIILQPFAIPFPLIYTSSDEPSNAIMVLQGIQPGQHLCDPRPPPEDELAWLIKYNRTINSGNKMRQAGVHPGLGSDFVESMLYPACLAYDLSLASLAKEELHRTIQETPPPSEVVELLARLESADNSLVKAWEWTAYCEFTDSC